MIRELKPLLSSRALTFTVASVGDDRIRVNVFPTKIGNDENSLGTLQGGSAPRTDPSHQLYKVGRSWNRPACCRFRSQWPYKGRNLAQEKQTPARCS
jgi:hypothetical protein